MRYKSLGFMDQGPGTRDQGPGTRDQGRGKSEEGKNNVYLIAMINAISLFCHSPVFPIIKTFYKQGILSNTAFDDDILKILALS